MSPNDWAALAVAITTLIGSLAIGVRHLVKHFLSELKPNGGSSIKDQVNRLEEKVDTLYQVLIQRGRND
jgi:hypothetical protein